MAAAKKKATPRKKARKQPAPKVFDIADINLTKEADDGSDLHLLNPRNGLPIFAGDDPDKPCVLRLLGAHSKKVGKKTEQIKKRREKREADRYNELISEGRSPEQAQKLCVSTDEEKRLDDAEVLAAATSGWENLAYNGKTELTEDLAIQMYADPDPGKRWIFIQAFRHVMNAENFTPGRKTS